MLIALSPAPLAAQSAPSPATRPAQPVDPRYRWDLTDLYARTEDWEADLARADGLLGQFDALRGRIGSAETLHRALRLRDEISLVTERLYAYAMLRHHENVDDKPAQALYGRASDFNNRVAERLSWLAPSLLGLPQEMVTQWLESSDELKVYRHWWEDLQRQRPHVRSPAEEELLAMAGPIADGPENTFSLFTNADLKFGTVRDDRGAEIEMTSARYMAAIYSGDRRYRRDAFLALHDGYARHANTLASLLATQVKRDLFYARARHYGNPLEAALGPNAIPVEVYTGLISCINQHLPLLHRYTALRKRVLRLDELHAYDLYVPLVAESREHIPFDHAVATILEALAVLGDEYVAPMRMAFENRWIDVYEAKNKRSGAYCMGVYQVHPYLLLNYTDNANARSTLAHEMGHAMHSWFTQKNQPPVYGDYTIFCAEVASTVNEAILNDYLLKRAASDAERIRLLNSSLENIRTTVFRQTLFAEFERTIHDLAQQQRPLTPDVLFATYRELCQRYYGPLLVVDPVLDAECLRIPHFYRNFYVYQYATSYCGATSIARRILQREPGAREGYLEFLKSGRSDYSIPLLRRAGVDMASATPYADTMKLFEDQLMELERLLEKAAAG